MITIKTLTRLYFRQLFRYRKNELFSLAGLLLYGWIGALALVQFRDRFPLWLFFLTFILSDFVLFKLLTQKDGTVMDAFLKTRPVPQRRWWIYQVLCQCWNHYNLMMPLILLPLCLHVFPTGTAFLAFAGLYLVSVAGGLLNMLIKRRGAYGKEDAVRVNSRQTLWGSRFGSGTLGIQVKGFLRSKLLVAQVTLFAYFMYLIFFKRRNDSDAAELYLFMTILLTSTTFPLYGLSIEACFFNGLWTKPVTMRRLLVDKYLFNLMYTGLVGLLCVPVALVVHVPLLRLLADLAFGGGFCALVLLVDAYSCRPFDPFARASFASGRRRQNPTRFSSFCILMGIMIGYTVLRLSTPAPVLTGILLGLGLLAAGLHRPYFAWRERKFLEDRYYYMEKFSDQ